MEVGAALVKAPAVELTLVRPRSGRKQSAQRRCAIERGGGYGESAQTHGTAQWPRVPTP